MFYSQFILAKKGPLGTIWIAAHLERKLRKNQVAEMDIGVTVDSILFPEVPIALRLSGHLLLGVVRIYSRQVNYLFNDCSETLGKIKQAFHSAAVDLPPEATTAPFHTITLPETFDFDELELVPDSESSYLHRNGNYVDQHVTTREQITLQDTVDHNPYLGSSQFGLDERFDDGNYFPFGLDFDEEFLTEKAPPLDAGTSMPLLKEDTLEPPSGTEGTSAPLPKEDVMVPSAGCENEATPMDIDDHCQLVTATPTDIHDHRQPCHEVDLLGERAKTISEHDSLERDNQLTTCAPAVSIEPMNAYADSYVSVQQGPDFTHLKRGGLSFNAYTPRALEACTPDLNQEYCPPDEPSTPALVYETSLPVYNERMVDIDGRFSPAFSGHLERIPGPETLGRSLQPHHVDPWPSSTESIRSPNDALFQGFEAAPVAEVNRECGTRIKNALIAPVMEKVASMFCVSPSLPQQACLQQIKTDVSLVGVTPLETTPYSLLSSIAPRALTQPVGNPASLGANQWGHCLDRLVGNPASFANNEWDHSLNQAISSPNPQQGFVVCHSPTHEVGTEPSGLGPLGISSNAIVEQVSTASLVSLPSINLPPSVSLSAASCSTTRPSLLSSGQMEGMGAITNSAPTQGPFLQFSGQQFNPSSSVEMAHLWSPRGMEECEILRSGHDLQTTSTNFLVLQKAMADDRLPDLELSRNMALSGDIEGETKEVLLPDLDRTPVLKEETPFTAARASALSTPSVRSEPGDDDVLASILGQRTKLFKVIQTTKAQKLPKVTVPLKRPKLVPRATPKRRKVDLDAAAVLHGDIIRQQLANAEDIRRERRKAPCTRREVWGFLRECQGQENFDEPGVPELPSDLHELYHDVVHGREPKEGSDAKLAMDAKGAYLADSVENDCMELGSVKDSDLLASYVKRLSTKDACSSQSLGIIENDPSEKCAEQAISNEDSENVRTNQVIKSGESCSLDEPLEDSKEHRDAQVEADQILSVGLMAATDNVGMPRAEEVSGPEVGTEVLSGTEGQAISVPEAQSGEVETLIALRGSITEEIDLREKTTEEQAVQVIEPERKAENVDQLQDVSMISSFSEGVLDSNVVNEGVAMVEENHTEGQWQPDSNFQEQDSHEGQLLEPSQDASLQVSDIAYYSGRDSTELPLFQAGEAVDNGNIEGGDDKVLTSIVSEEGENACRNDEEMVITEPEKDTDCVDEESDLPYADIDYSSDEQDVIIQDDSGWSTRSRNVGKYLKSVFEEMRSGLKWHDQGEKLGLNQLLGRRTRREAARMFFETLVLKTKDYVHVEQNVPYQDVMLYPKAKLMKTEF